MRSYVRFSFIALLVSVSVAVVAPAAAQADFGLQRFFAANCKAAAEKCGETANPTLPESEAQGYTQAAGHPPFGITDFELKHHVIQTSPFAAEAPEGNLKNLRTDVAPGVSTNPQAVPRCSIANFTGTELEPAPGVKAFTAPNCPGSEIGKNVVRTVVEVATGVFKNYEFEGIVYNLEQPTGLSSDFGVALNLEPLLGAPLYSHTFIEGHVEWASDYHDYFEIKNITPGLIRSRLIFKGNIGTGGFLANPSSCLPPGPATTTGWSGESYEGATAVGSYKALVGTEGCDGASPFEPVPFAPTFSLTPGAGETGSDQPDGITTELGLPHDPNPANPDSSQLKTASVTLPEGMTLNPSAAAGLTACTPAQARITSKTPGVACPESSKLGTVELNVPGLPDGSLNGNVYLGGPETGAITDPPYTVYVDAESQPFGISVRLKGSVNPDLTTGRVTTSFTENPEQPFSNLVLNFKGGPLAPIANPLTCGTARTQTVLTPFTGTAAQMPTSSFVVDSDSKGGACPASPPFALAQSTSNQTTTAGGHTNYTFNLSRGEGQQYLSQVKTTLPAGVVGAIPTVTPCTEAQAVANACPPASQIGTASAVSGSGPTPFTFGGGTVYLTGPYQGAPYGLSVVVPAVAGPFNLGPVTTRAKLEIDQTTARVTTTAVLPQIVKGVPIRLRGLSVSINKQGFLYNPTNCGTLATESTLTSTLGATQSLSSPFQVGSCNLLKFKPTFKAVTSSRTSKANGASLETTLNEVPGNANVKSVKVQLPKALPSRLTTLQKACPAATFEADYHNCPSGSFVGGARANTPTLPGKLQGPAILVSHAAEAFPDLDLVMEANGVRSVLVGNTDIKKGITTTTFASTPDVPVSSITVNLPIGAHSALAANGSLCAGPLVMPTTMTGQNGVVVKQNTTIKVNTCGVRVVGHRIVGNTAYLTVQTYAPGRISGKGSGLANTFRKLAKAQKTATLKVPLSRGGRARRKPFSVKLRVGFVPKAKGGKSSVAFVTVRF